MATASRVRILARLRAGDCPVGELSEELDMEQPAVSHQLRILRDLGLVVGTRVGRQVFYGLFGLPPF
jgi:DNA-binding transcriptional ArsR family regulator